MRMWGFAMAAICLCWGVTTWARQGNSAIAAAPAPAAGASRVAGIVTNSRTGEPVGKARVMLVDTANPRAAVTVVTQEDGRFEFNDVPPGKYALSGASRGFLTGIYEQHGQYNTAVVTGSGFNTENLKLKLAPMAWIAGKVLDESGEGIRQASVTLYSQNHQGGLMRVVVIERVQTDDQGTFEFGPLAPGKYYVSASATPWYATRVPSGGQAGLEPVDVERSLDVAYPIMFAGGATDAASAQTTVVKAGDREQIDIRMSPMPAVRFTFRIDNEAEQGVMPNVVQKVFGQYEQVLDVEAQPIGDGEYEMRGMPPGKYVLQTSGNGSPARRSEIEVGRSNGADLGELHGETDGELKLKVNFPAGEESPQNLQVVLVNDNLEGVAGETINPDGAAEMPGVPPGDYAIWVFGRPTYAVEHMNSGETRIAGNRIRVKAGQKQELEVFLVAGRTRVLGFATRGGKAAAGMMVLLLPSEGARADLNLMRMDQSDMDGTFTLPDVIPGAYTLTAVSGAWGQEWNTPEALAHFAEKGQKLTIGPLMRGVVHLPEGVEVIEAQ